MSLLVSPVSRNCTNLDVSPSLLTPPTATNTSLVGNWVFDPLGTTSEAGDSVLPELTWFGAPGDTGAGGVPQ